MKHSAMRPSGPVRVLTNWSSRLFAGIWTRFFGSRPAYAARRFKSLTSRRPYSTLFSRSFASNLRLPAPSSSPTKSPLILNGP